jgi:hypothetical protein
LINRGDNQNIVICNITLTHLQNRDRRGHNRMVVEFNTNYAISAYHHLSCELEYHSRRGVLDTTLCDKNLSVTCGRSMVFSGYSGILHQ